MGSQLRLTDIFGFGIPYILCTRLMHLLLECTSPTLSGISTHSQEGSLNSFESQLILTMAIRLDIPYILYQKLLCLCLGYTSPTLSGISTLNQEGVSTHWSYSPH